MRVGILLSVFIDLREGLVDHSVVEWLGCLLTVCIFVLNMAYLATAAGSLLEVVLGIGLCIALIIDIVHLLGSVFLSGDNGASGLISCLIHQLLEPPLLLGCDMLLVTIRPPFFFIFFFNGVLPLTER